jgi:flagellin-specific chaperone FliS
VRLTILLYEQIIQDLTRAIDAIAQRKTESCAHELGHATSVIGYLHGTLKRDAGGVVVSHLGRFYTMIREAAGSPSALRARFWRSFVSTC